MPEQSIEEKLSILDNDLARKSSDTRMVYHCLVKRFLEESGDLSRQGMMRWFNLAEMSDNSLRTAYYALERLCKALEIKFPLDRDDLPPLPDEDTLNTPTITIEDVAQLIAHWRMYPGTYETALVFISTVFGTRTCEMSATQQLTLTSKQSIIINVAKRKGKAVREHVIPEIYWRYVDGYQNLSENSVRDKFRKVMKHAGLKRADSMSWHSVRRALATAFKLGGVEQELYKRFMRWAPNRDDMASVYTHVPFDQINSIILGQVPNPQTKLMVKHPFLGEWS